MGNVETEKPKAVAGVTDRAAEDGKIEGASSGLKIARTVEPTGVAATAQHGAAPSVAQNIWWVAGETMVKKGSEDWQTGNAGAKAETKESSELTTATDRSTIIPILVNWDFYFSGKYDQDTAQ